MEYKAVQAVNILMGNLELFREGVTTFERWLDRQNIPRDARRRIDELREDIAEALDEINTFRLGALHNLLAEMKEIAVNGRIDEG